MNTIITVTMITGIGITANTGITAMTVIAIMATIGCGTTAIATVAGFTITRTSRTTTTARRFAFISDSKGEKL